ncbi:hypothetical protein [Marinomonas sp. 2405UD68-3]|uniref:hypothetical protein n=1 Tax=Marinomonas sp. 2405UD68-3 TaxID=3391835 RepID=UPI0039C9E130
MKFDTLSLLIHLEGLKMAILNQYTSIIVIFLSFTLSQSAHSNDSNINAVIGLSSSQVVERNLHNEKPQLPIERGSLLPLDNAFNGISFPIENHLSLWIQHINQEVKVEHKSRQLNFQGQLDQVTQNAFSLKINNTSVTLPISDFYLIPNVAASRSNDPKHSKFTGNITYQTPTISWQPKLSILFQNNAIKLVENALISNRSNKNLVLENPILHLSQSSNSNVKFKTERLSVMASDSIAAVNYSNDEIIIPLNNRNVELSPFTEYLTPIQQQTLPILKRTLKSSISTYPQFLGELSLQFTQTYEVKLSKETLPGSYQTYWQKQNLYLPSNNIFLEKTRLDQTLELTPNQSHDIESTLKLVNASGRKLPISQTWELTLKNLSKEKKNYQINHNMNGIIANITGSPSEPNGIHSRQFVGALPAQQTKVLRYTVTLTQ